MTVSGRSDRGARRSEQPSREWAEKHFIHDGKVKFCTACGSVPFVAMGPVHGCHGMSGIEAYLLGLGGEWAEENVDWSRFSLVENEDRPGDWMGSYVVRGDE